jgi:3-hydroxybutyryl-CoA dehydrogenase
MEGELIGVIGAGVMGAGVAQTLAQTKHRVILTDRTDELLAKSKSAIEKNLRLQAFFHESNITPAETLDRIHFTTDDESLRDTSFIIENVTEKWDVKKAVYARLDSICTSHCIFASNTSAISITRIGSVTRRPAKVIGMHFMNPVPMKKVVEVIRGHHTSDETLEKSKTLLLSMGKECVVINDSPGFVSNRVLMLTINEAVFLVQDQVAKAEEIDRIFKSCFEHKMGPLETADLIGLDTILFSLEVLYDSYNDSKYRPSPLLRKMVDAGLYGRKNGQGFYSYTI